LVIGNKIQAMVVDSTASNTGRINGACIFLKQKLDRQLLLLACRHHMYEIVLAGVFSESKLSVISGPDIPVFKKFQKIGQILKSRTISLLKLIVRFITN
jgi:hypothetical protein